MIYNDDVLKILLLCSILVLFFGVIIFFNEDNDDKEIQSMIDNYIINGGYYNGEVNYPCTCCHACHCVGSEVIK